MTIFYYDDYIALSIARPTVECEGREAVMEGGRVICIYWRTILSAKKITVLIYESVVKRAL